VKLLGYLEQRQCGGGAGPELDARIIAGSAHTLETDVRSGRLREDLFFRLNVVAIALPPRRRADGLARRADCTVVREAVWRKSGPLALV
jgi:transcriptional regulator with PAS, ATPase and Fis domain